MVDSTVALSSKETRVGEREKRQTLKTNCFLRQLLAKNCKGVRARQQMDGL